MPSAAKTKRKIHGWAVIEIHDGGEFDVHNYRMNINQVVRAS